MEPLKIFPTIVGSRVWGTVETKSRLLGSWHLTLQITNGGTTMWKLAGAVLSGDQDIIPTDVTRHTTTSPIRSVKGRVIVTASGSTYTLSGEPAPVHIKLLEHMGLEYNPEEPIPEAYQNKDWLDGDNWLTIP